MQPSTVQKRAWQLADNRVLRVFKGTLRGYFIGWQTSAGYKKCITGGFKSEEMAQNALNVRAQAAGLKEVQSECP